ncbi:MAG: 3-oxoacyl-ACP synthase, partial [Muribaculaceae bacterium]|nr:3-oxoacyl-ACP synthase [Muribaculaceae bacterium]
MDFKEIKGVVISPQGAFVDGVNRDSGNLKNLYRSVAGDYPKFFKMDMLCRIGFIAAEYLLKGYDENEKENMSVVLFNKEGSLLTDRNYTETIIDKDNYYPSPALFVYTLANIVTGEIAIRHKIYGESSFYITDSPDFEKMRITAE